MKSYHSFTNLDCLAKDWAPKAHFLFDYIAVNYDVLVYSAKRIFRRSGKNHKEGLLNVLLLCYKSYAVLHTKE